MRCSFRSTTALAAALALTAPAALLAETPMAPSAAAAMDAAARADMPKRAATLDKELAKGLGPDGLACLGGEARPCPDGEPLVTPKGVAVHLAQDGTVILAPRAEQRGGQAADQDKGDKKGKSAEGEARRDGEQAAGGRERPAAKPAKAEASGGGKAQDKAERKAARAAARQSGDPEAAPDADALAASLAAAGGDDEAPVATAQTDAPAAEPVPLPEAASPAADAEPAKPPREAKRPKPTPADAPQGDPAVEDAAAERAGPIPAPEPQPAPEPVDAQAGATPPEPAVVEPAPAKRPGAEPQAAPVVAEPAAEASPKGKRPGAKPESAPEQRAAKKPKGGDAATPDAAALAAALAADGDGKAAAEAPAEATAVTAGATGQAEAPTPIVVDEGVTRSVEDALRKEAEAKKRRADKRRQAEAAGKPAATQAGATAADAAAAEAAGRNTGTAPVVEALNAPTTISEDATAVVVTEGSARSASEDFATRITDGLTREQQLQLQQLQERAARKRRDRDPVVVGDGSEASDDDGNDDERDLARLLLAGVGGYVLANVLANNGQIALSTPDRVVVQQPDGTQTIIKDDNALLLQPGAQVTTEDFADGSSRTIVTREDGSRVVTIRDANLRVLRRTLIAADGTVTELIDDAAPVDPVVVADLPAPAQPVELSDQVNEDALRAALAQEAAVDRRFTLGQIRNIAEVRGLVAPIEIDAITFDTGSAAIRPDQAQQLATLGKVISDYVRANPGEVFLIEGHTDTVGSAAMNLALSDRRAESVALALTQYFQVPPENLVVQGYGEQFLKVNQEGDIRANRRASVRRITDLLASG